MADRDAQRVVDDRAKHRAGTTLVLELHRQEGAGRHAAHAIPAAVVRADGRRALATVRAERRAVDLHLHRHHADFLQIGDLPCGDGDQIADCFVKRAVGSLPEDDRHLWSGI